ncbi:protein of unknown function [Chitinophaga jiangningensis]|uniref:DUF4260 domain-containing protein n=1 Tax=Chitinophaga jiangningensis TaxID=1419482 RepID=A0A1M7AU08_9BACT|nr:DUF4260 domain-containing protein [Chitinophaga jiangningensis]SHL46151.1 protein of unknown function [Chitinophaga jiangningensis]
MKKLLQAEEILLTAASIYLLSKYSLGLSIWVWIPLFLAPDLSMLGYLVNTRVGAWTYNLFHHRGIAVAIAATGYAAGIPVLLTAGLLLFAHSTFDRMMGYGLKYNDDFGHTHLGKIGKAARS